MTIKIAWLTYSDALQPIRGDVHLMEALRAREADVHIWPWDGQGPPPDAPEAVVVRSPWNYYYATAAFEAFLGELAEHQATVLNPVATLRWNMDKRYLRELAARGIALPETLFVDPGHETTLEELVADRDWEEAVIKPLVSGNAHNTWRCRPEAIDDQVRQRFERQCTEGLMVQRFAPQIADSGELSLIYFGGSSAGYSHAVRKRPKLGDFRVQLEHGGASEACTPSATMRQAADRVLAATAWPWDYARVDLIDSPNGPLLMELELLEPELFFEVKPQSADIFADHIVARARHTR